MKFGVFNNYCIFASRTRREGGWERERTMNISSGETICHFFGEKYAHVSNLKSASLLEELTQGGERERERRYTGKRERRIK